MKKILPIAFIVLSAYAAKAGFSIDWMRTPNLPANKGTYIARDAADNIYTTTSTGDIYLEKRDKFGNLLWQQHSFTTLQFNYEHPSQIHVDPLGNPVVVGYRHTTSSDGHNANALIVLKYDAAGTLLYKMVIDGSFSYFNNSQYWTNVTSQMDSDGNIYVGTAGEVTGYPQHGFNVIKISPAGNIIRVSTKNFTSATGFHFVTKTRLVNNLIGVTGVTDYSSANATTWAMDTAGTDLWNAITAGIQGKDITFDNSGNAWMLTWISPNFSGDISLFKFDISGNQLWNKTFDFGGSDLASRLEKTPDGNLAIMAYGNSAPNGSYYVDWITFKTDTAGNLLWSDRYDEHTSNDELPHMMAVDQAGNIYVTGIGGPFPGGNNLGKRQMVTVKYDPSGTREWTSPLDTINEYLTGEGITIGSDSSIFVLGDLNTFIVHYLDHMGSAPCSVPTGLTNISVTDTTSTVSWNTVSNAYLYHVQYKRAVSTTWEIASTNQVNFTIPSLFPGTLYDYRVEAVCNSGPTGYSTAQQFTTSGTGYCASAGMDASHEWIDLVYLETILNSTIDPDSGYSDFTYLSADLFPGNTYDISLSAGMDIAQYTEFWKVWIDFNRNGDFTDAGEEVVSYSSVQIGWETNSFQVPANASPGTTVMRVSMKNGSAPTSCELFGLGEVEDYSINILSPTGITDVTAGASMKIIRHSGNDAFTIACSDLSGRTYNLRVMDAMGREIYSVDGSTLSGNISEEIPAGMLSGGIYFVSVSTEKENLLRRVSK